jgi:hypothetical protein
LWDSNLGRRLSLNITVTEPTATGNLRLWPADMMMPEVSTLDYAAGLTRGNNAIIGLDTLGRVSISARQFSGFVHVILDVNGYFE